MHLVFGLSFVVIRKNTFMYLQASDFWLTESKSDCVMMKLMTFIPNVNSFIRCILKVFYKFIYNGTVSDMYIGTQYSKKSKNLL